MMTATQYFNKEFIHNILEPAFEFNEFFIVDSDNNIYELDTKDIKLSENNIIDERNIMIDLNKHKNLYQNFNEHNEKAAVI